MQISNLRIYVVLLYLPLIFATLLPVLPDTSINQWETAASSIIHRYINVLHNVKIICENACVSDNFLQKIPIPVQNSMDLQEYTLILTVVRTRQFVTSVLDSAANYTRSRFVIFVDCDECVLPIAWILEQCWSHMFLNVVVIPITSKNLSVYTYFPFRDGACFDLAPILIDTFTTSFPLNVELFPKQKVWNLHNCTLKISSFDLHPVLYFENTQMKGLYAPIFYAVADSMNFSPQFALTDKRFGFVASPKQAVGLRGDVFLRRVHLGFSLLSPLDIDYLDYDSLPMTGCVTWCCPGGLKKKALSWLIIGEFSPTVWTMLLLAFVGILATDLLLRKLSPRGWLKPKAPMYMIVLGALLQGYGGRPTYLSTHLRAFWLSWLLLSAVLPTVYVSTMKSFQAAPLIAYSPSNFEELANAGLQAWFHQGHMKMVDAVSESNAIVAKLKAESFVYPPDMYSSMVDRLRYKNITTLLEINLCKIYSEMYASNFTLYPLPDACMQVSPVHVFVMSKRSVFIDAVASRMFRLTQAGIVQRTWSGSKTLPRHFQKIAKALSLDSLLPPFWVLACGLFVSSVSFLFESLWMRYNSLKKMTRKNMY